MIFTKRKRTDDSPFRVDGVDISEIKLFWCYYG